MNAIRRADNTKIAGGVVNLRMAINIRTAIMGEGEYKGPKQSEDFASEQGGTLIRRDVAERAAKKNPDIFWPIKCEWFWAVGSDGVYVPLSVRVEKAGFWKLCLSGFETVCIPVIDDYFIPSGLANAAPVVVWTTEGCEAAATKALRIA